MPLPSNAPQPAVVTSMRDRIKSGIGQNYVDTYNDLQMAKYNNEFNYWLWQQQNEYNTPAAQMQRARDAGLNPNAIAGNVSSGNAASPSPSSGRLSGNIRANQMQSVNAALNTANSLISAISNGVGAVSKISGIPSDIPTYRKLLTSALQFSSDNEFVKKHGYLLDNMLKQLNIAVTTERNYEMDEHKWSRLSLLGGMPSWIDDVIDQMHQHNPVSRISRLTESEISAAERKLEMLSEQINNLKKQGLHIDADTIFKEIQSRLTQKELEWFTANTIEKYLMDGFGAFLNYRSRPFYR